MSNICIQKNYFSLYLLTIKVMNTSQCVVESCVTNTFVSVVESCIMDTQAQSVNRTNTQAQSVNRTRVELWLVQCFIDIVGQSSIPSGGLNNQHKLDLVASHLPLIYENYRTNTTSTYIPVSCTFMVNKHLLFK